MLICSTPAAKQSFVLSAMSKNINCSIAYCSERNVRVLHLAGHGRKECGFIWNADDDAKESKEFDIDAISRAIGMAAGAKGPLECVVLNA